MAAYYLDTSALVKLYIEEAGTDKLLGLAANIERGTWAVSDLTRVEFRAAAGRRRREGDISPETSREIFSELDQHIGSLYLVQPVTSSVVEGLTVFNPLDGDITD